MDLIKILSESVSLSLNAIIILLIVAPSFLIGYFLGGKTVLRGFKRHLEKMKEDIENS